MTPLDQTISFKAQLFLCLVSKRRKMLLYINHCEDFGKGIPEVRDIAKFAGCKERNVRDFFKFNEEMNNIFFTKEKRFKNGRQRSNRYFIDKTLKKAITWLDIHGFLLSPRSKMKHIISSIEKQESCTPRLEKIAPLLSLRDSLFRDEERKRRQEFAFINPILEDLKMPLEAKIYASKTFSDHKLARARESMLWRLRNGGLRTSQAAYIIGAAKRI